MASALLSRSLRKLRSTSWTRSTLSRPTCSFFSTDATVTPPKYTIVRHPVSQEPITPVDYFAVVKLGGTQYKVTQGDIVIAEKLKDAKVGELLDINDVLLLGNLNETIVGRPVVEGAKVIARVEEQTLDKKIDIFKKKRRKNYRRWNGFRRQVTVLRVTDVVPIDTTA